MFAHFEMYVEPLEGQCMLQDVHCWTVRDTELLILLSSSCNVANVTAFVQCMHTV